MEWSSCRSRFSILTGYHAGITSTPSGQTGLGPWICAGGSNNYAYVYEDGYHHYGAALGNSSPTSRHGLHTLCCLSNVQANGNDQHLYADASHYAFWTYAYSANVVYPVQYLTGSRLSKN